ncbi:DUF4129 domain-containing protein [Oscillibacter sp.]|uniref:DUF4129 domain-containing protein n=1 Tax=Oscillibacter sp. TaxID=1945593 RepID=UPI0026135B7C|nr:DUF4129 domain-containing protein [Oscillibacter sp.]MDD3346448.1 DUF4129 domain-containing protein [Oscillibacter sp.]
MDERKTLPALSMQFSTAAIFCSLTYLMTPEKETIGLFYPQVLLLYAPLIYWINRLFLRRSRTMRAATVLNGAAAIALLAAIALITGGSLVFLLFAGIFCVWLTAQGVQGAQQTPKLHQMIIALDLSLLVLVLLTGYTALTGIGLCWSAPIAAGCAAAIVGVVCRRTGGNLGGRGWSFIGCVFVLLSLALWLLVRFVAAPAGGGLVALWNGALGFLKFVGGMLAKVLLFLLSLFPVPDGELASSPLPPALAQAAQEVEKLDPSVLMAVAAVGLLLLAVAVIFLLHWLGRFRVGGETAEKAFVPMRRRLSLRGGLGRLFALWRERLGRALFLWRRRDLPDGLYYQLVRRCRRGKWRKRPGETPRDFLSRLLVSARDDRELSDALEALLPAVDAALFAPPAHAAQAVPGARLIRRRIKKAVRRQFLRSCRSRWAAAVRAKATIPQRSGDNV